jgi:hypothetical protein
LQQSVSASEDTNARTAQLVRLISEVGPDVPEISRRLGQFNESVRYRYKEKLLNKGFAIQAAIAYEKLGFKRVMFVCDFQSEYRLYANAILSAMNEMCYVVYFAKSIPDGFYLVDAAIPGEFIKPFARFVSDLKSKGLFAFVDIMTFEWVRNPPMRSEFYDFNVGRWDFDWVNMSPFPKDNVSGMPQPKEEFDMVDLLILKELQIDATKSLKEMATRLRINYKKLVWHYSKHVLDRQLVRSYRLNWMGTRYDYELEKALHRKHRYLSLVLIVKNTTDYERMELMSKLDPLPFLWFEAAGKNYYANFAFPIDQVTEALVYLESCLQSVRDRTEYYVLDSANALTFTFAYQLYDQEKKRWIFNPRELLLRFDNLLMRIKEQR